MIHQFDITLDHFVVADGKAVAAKGAKPLGRLNSEELLHLLEVFRNTNPIQAFEAEPEIVIHTRHEKYAVRTDLHRLHLYDLRHPDLPAQVLEAPALIAEVNLSASEARASRIKSAQGDTPDESGTGFSNNRVPSLPFMGPSRTLTPHSHAPWLLGSLAVFLAISSLACLILFRGEPKPVPDSLITEVNALSTLRRQLAGVYTTGNSPGHHGIVILPDGTLKLFEINRDLPPSLLQETYELGLFQGKPCLVIDRLEPLILAPSAGTLLYCDQLYRKAETGEAPPR